MRHSPPRLPQATARRLSKRHVNISFVSATMSPTCLSKHPRASRAERLAEPERIAHLTRTCTGRSVVVAPRRPWLTHGQRRHECQSFPGRNTCSGTSCVGIRSNRNGRARERLSPIDAVSLAAQFGPLIRHRCKVVREWRFPPLAPRKSPVNVQVRSRQQTGDRFSALPLRSGPALSHPTAT